MLFLGTLGNGVPRTENGLPLLCFSRSRMALATASSTTEVTVNPRPRCQTALRRALDQIFLDTDTDRNFRHVQTSLGKLGRHPRTVIPRA